MNESANNSTLTQYFNTLKGICGEENLKKYLDGDYKYSENAPFLSVIMRTQGKRPEALGEVLLNLAGQSDMDFEVLVMGHNLTEDGKTSVETIINELPPFMDGKVRLIEVIGGSRTTPLTKGFESANGRYVSILDDDDLVFENWVEAFHELEKENSGKILHAFCVDQDWRSMQNDYGETVLVSVSPFRPNYCCEFDMVKQFSTNYCPTFSLAFPRIAYDLLNIHFDETLTTTEDWDFLMRTALICGVADNPVVTGIYRKWINSENSATLHTETEWKKNYKYIRNKLLSNAVLLPANDSAKNLFSSQADSGSGEIKITEFTVLIDDGRGFTNDNYAKLTFKCDDEIWTAEVTNMAKFGEVRRIRIDPIANGSVTVKGLNVNATDLNGNKVSYRHDKLRTNGLYSKDSIIFSTPDPQCIINFNEPTKLANMSVNFMIHYDLPINFFRLTVFLFCIKKWTRATLSFARRVVLKVKRAIK
jgi:glycosyltransferase involved in cell wall biosynthesis